MYQDKKKPKKTLLRRPFLRPCPFFKKGQPPKTSHSPLRHLPNMHWEENKRVKIHLAKSIHLRSLSSLATLSPVPLRYIDLTSYSSITTIRFNFRCQRPSETFLCAFPEKPYKSKALSKKRLESSLNPFL